MLDSARIAVVVPAYNEARLIRRTLASIPKYVDHIVVVDDGSRDETAKVLAEIADPRLDVIRHRTNRGVGAAIATGYCRAFADGATVAAVMAGDGQMVADELIAVVTPVVVGDADYVKGDRLSHPAVRYRMPRLRRYGNRALSTLTRLATGLAISDSQCGFTALGRQAFDGFPLDRLWPGYGYPNDLLGHLAIGGAVVRETVVTPHYGDEKSGIRLHHALAIIPYVLGRVALRRCRAWLLELFPRRRGGLAPWQQDADSFDAKELLTPRWDRLRGELSGGADPSRDR